MEEYLDKIMNIQHYSVEIKAPVISIRDNINLKDTIGLIERQLEEQKLKPEMEITLPHSKYFLSNRNNQAKKLLLRLGQGEL